MVAFFIYSKIVIYQNVKFSNVIVPVLMLFGDYELNKHCDYS